MEMECFNSLPEEISLNILTRLPIESVLDSKLVCTNWRNLVSQNPLFSKIHLDHLNHPSDSAADSGKLGFIAKDENKKLYYFEYDERHELTPIWRIRKFNFILPIKNARVLDSCNGLICLVDYHDRSVCVCNPINKEHIVLPEIKTGFFDTDDVHRRYGFGYVSSTKEYKVVGVCWVLNSHVPEVHIYTLGSGLGWRNLGKFNPEFSMHPWEQPIFANETLYWTSNKLETIVTFDLAEEKFCESLSPPPLPETPHHNDWSSNKIGVLDGSLYFAIYRFVEGAEWYDIWLLRKKNDNHDMRDKEEHQSWVFRKELRVEESKILAAIESGGVLCYNSRDKELCIYDIKSPTSKWVVDWTIQLLQVFPHKNTLVSLKELREEDSKTMEYVEVDERRSQIQPPKKLLMRSVHTD